MSVLNCHVTDIYLVINIYCIKKSSLIKFGDENLITRLSGFQFTVKTGPRGSRPTDYNKNNLLSLVCLHIQAVVMYSFAYSLRSLKSNKQLWAIRSGQMSNSEQIAQVAQVKSATVSELLRSLMTNEQQWAIRSGRSLKTSNLLRKPMSEFPTLIAVRMR